MTDVVIAMDIGGTGMKCALVDAGHAIVHAERHATGADRGPDAVVATILEVAAGLAETARAAGLTPIAVGLAAPGVIDEANGIAVWSANVGFRGVPLRDLVAAHVGLPAALGHDVRAGGRAEALLGAGRDVRRAWFVAIGTGIAAAYVDRRPGRSRRTRRIRGDRPRRRATGRSGVRMRRARMRRSDRVGVRRGQALPRSQRYAGHRA